MKILVTGFDPFGDDKINPAIEAVKRLDDEIAGAKIIKVEYQRFLVIVPMLCMMRLNNINQIMF